MAKTTEQPVAETPATGKGHATPTRKEQEAARKQPLVSSDRAEARRKARAQMQLEREKARVGMANGDEKYLPVRDRGPQKRFVRDYVDARFSVGELLIPLMFAVIILTFFPDPLVQTIGLFALWAFFAVAILDVVILGFVLQRKLAAKFGADRVEKFRWYAAMRALQLRLMRLPKPQVKRFQYPE
ncbi:MAG: hypothetical protein BGO97_15350 [Micrococcales bacterium 70-64]|nr:DUF3043 domain-containing protein [Leifsonia sp.]ODU65278.1 MAG: hypothetical protein ABT06_15350 [Leifsonia sp. SCN 70-46]OJX86969.1 MAG: hypothetical protein BGO97_15350 [Micrococcales bacterium 70-64]